MFGKALVALTVVFLIASSPAAAQDPATARQESRTRLLATYAQHTDAVLSLAFNPRDGRSFASGGRDKNERDMSTIRFWNIKGEVLYSARPAFGSVSLLKWSPDGRYMLSMSQNHYDKYFMALRHPVRVLLWDPSRPRWIKWIDRGQMNEVFSFDFSPDGKRFVLAGKDKTVQLWSLSMDIHKIVPTRMLIGHKGCLSAVAFSPSGMQLASGSMDRTIRIWDPNKVAQQLIKTLNGHTDSVNALAYTPDGKTLVSGSSDKSVRIWNVADGKTVHTLEGHTACVNDVAVTPDGKHALSISNDATLRIWDVRKGKLLQTLKDHKGAVQALSLSPDGKLILTGGDDKTIRVWSMGTYTGGR